MNRGHANLLKEGANLHSTKLSPDVIQNSTSAWQPKLPKDFGLGAGAGETGIQLYCKGLGGESAPRPLSASDTGCAV